MPTTPSGDRIRIGELARRSGVPAATIKHYIREGLLEEPLRTSRNSAWYDPAEIPKIQAIKELQRTRFLPLSVIREVLAEADRGRSIARAVDTVLQAQAGEERRSRDDVIDGGVEEAQIAFFEATGLVTPETVDGQTTYAGDDLRLLRLLHSARQAGITAEMLPHTVLPEYLRKVRELAEFELELFEKGILPRAGAALDGLVESASELSETLVLVLRRKVLRDLVAEWTERTAETD